MTRVVESPFFSAKDPAEVVTLTFDFVNLTDTPTSPDITVTRHAGTADASPSAILSGSATISGTKTLQQVQDGVDGTSYRMRCKVFAPDGSEYVLTGILPVKSQL